MKVLILISVLCIASTIADNPPYDYSLNQTFKLQVFIPYASYFTTALAVTSNDDLIASNTSYITFNLTNGVLSSDSNQFKYFLKNQTGTGYPPYILKRGQANPADCAIFKASTSRPEYGRYVAPEIEANSSLPVTNGWIACNTTDNVYSIGWDPDVTSQPREGCINVAKYNPGVLLYVGFL